MSTPGEIEAIKSVIARHEPRKATNYAEVEFRDALNRIHIPRASKLLDKVHEGALQALEEKDYLGFKQLCELYLKTCGLIKPASDDAKVAALAKALVDQMIGEARSRREAKP